MRTPSVQIDGRGLVRGLFLSVAIVFAVSCDKPKQQSAPDVSVEADLGRAVDAASSDVALDLPPTPPAEFSPPWTTLAPAWDELKVQVATAEVGKISGEMWGKDSVVRAIVRSHCGRGAMLQAVFEGPKGLQVTPAMPVRFFGLATGKSVLYEEGIFRVTVNFTEDTPERLAGRLTIVYDEHGQEKTFVDLTVDSKPIPMLLAPRLQGEGNLPEFQNCHPSGRFYARAADGRVAQGYANAGSSADAKGVVATVFLTRQSGLRFVVYSKDALKEPWTTDLAKAADGAPVRVGVEAFYTPELTSPISAQGPNLGSEQLSKVRKGTVQVVVERKKKRPVLKLSVKDLEIPVLLAGPLRGTTFSQLELEAVGYPLPEYPDPPTPEPLAPGGGE